MKNLLKKLEPHLFMTPGYLILLVFMGYPLLNCIRLAFSNYKVTRLDDVTFAGFANFRRIFEDPQIGMITLNTLKFVVITLALQLILGFILALALKKPFPLSELPLHRRMQGPQHRATPIMHHPLISLLAFHGDPCPISPLHVKLYGVRLVVRSPIIAVGVISHSQTHLTFPGKQEAESLFYIHNSYCSIFVMLCDEVPKCC